MAAYFCPNIPENLAFQDYLAVIQTTRTWADGYDLKSYPHLISTLAPEVTIDYSDVNPAWGLKHYQGEDFAREWLSDEHLGNEALRTQHLLGLPYFAYVGPRRTGAGAQSSDELREGTQKRSEVEEIQVSWQTLASHGRHTDASLEGSNSPMAPIGETSDHRAFVTHVFIKTDLDERSQKRVWKLSLIKPSPIYGTGDFARIRRPANIS